MAAPPPTPSPEAIARWISRQRWFEQGPPDTSEPGGPLTLSLSEPVAIPGATGVGVQIATTPGGDRYQLVVPTGRSDRSAPSAPTVDVAGDGPIIEALVRLCTHSGSPPIDRPHLEGHWMDGAALPGTAPTRPLRVDQSNTSVVVGGTHILKVIRRPEPGVHPEVEVGRHLLEMATRLATRPPVAPLCGWYELVDHDGPATTLGVVHAFMVGAIDGWELTLAGLAADPGALLSRLHQLGSDIAQLHRLLSQPSDQDRFGRSPFTAEDLTAVATSITSAARRLQPTLGPGLVIRIEETVAHLAEAIETTEAGAVIRTHGDLHLGQTVSTPEGWVILDFEGEPSRSLTERHHPRPALRDVAGMIRSLSYAVESVRRAGGPPLDGWEGAARAAVLDGYLGAADPDLIPVSAPGTVDLLGLFEIEKAVYEVGYELAHRPDWVTVPVEGLQRALDRLNHGALR